jgi:hypothetical protein
MMRVNGFMSTSMMWVCTIALVPACFGQRLNSGLHTDPDMFRTASFSVLGALLLLLSVSCMVLCSLL